MVSYWSNPDNTSRDGEAPAEPFSEMIVKRDTRLGGSLALPPCGILI